jgi:FkbM family methyltransferase
MERRLAIKELPSGVRLVINLADRAIGMNILHGRFELNELEFVRRTVRQGQHVIDVGAHVGLFAMHMAALVGAGGSVHAFEPMDENAECLELGVRENRFDDRLIVERKAVGRESATGQLAIVPNSPNTGGAFLLQADTPVPGGYDIRPVPVVALDDCALRRPVSFIKLDAKGGEPFVVSGALRLLHEDRPIVLSQLDALHLRRAAGVSTDAFVGQMNAAGYRCHELGAGVVGEVLAHVPAAGVTPVVFLPLD